MVCRSFGRQIVSRSIAREKIHPSLVACNKHRIDERIATGQLKPQPIGVISAASAELIRIYDGIEHRVLVLATGEFMSAGKR